MQIIRSANGCEKALLSGYFSTLCAILPDLTKLGYEILKSLGFQVKEIMVHSQCDVKCTDINSSQYDHRVEALSFAQLIYSPFSREFHCIGEFWNTVARNAGIRFPICLFNLSDVKLLHSAFMASGLSAKLRCELHRSKQALGATGTPFGAVFYEASKQVSDEAMHFSPVPYFVQ